jgi:penicillin-binding protein 1C
VVVAATLAALWVRLGPLPAGFLSLADPTSTVVVDRHGETLYESRSVLGTRAIRLSADALPPQLISATLAAEDARFFGHSGVDPIAIARAGWANLRALRRVEGGSTISQQVVKLLLLRQNSAAAARGWTAKFREAVLAERLEHRLTKREILALYLNLAPYGNQITGAERAAIEYFGRSASTLTAAESAFLAALPQQPSRFNPRRDPARARPRQLAILRVEAEHGWLTAADRATAQAERLSLAAPASAMLAPHFVERVLAANPNLARIETTLDAALQRTVAGIIAAKQPALDAHHADNVAVVVLDNASGDWLAWEGSGHFGDGMNGGSIDGVVTPRQPGSALKPFTYAAALESGVLPSRILADVPQQFPTAVSGILYSPRNYDGQFRGPMLLRTALAGSENVPAVVLASGIGVPAVAQFLRRAGLTTLTKDAAYYGLGLTLGNAEVRLDELTSAYAAFARDGQLMSPRAVLAADGIATPAPTTATLLSPRTAFWITSMLSDADARAYVFGRGGSLEFPFAVAAKTGTSTSYNDNWTIGYTREVTVGVWVGNFDRTPLHNSSGVTGAGPIFHDVMVAAMERVRHSPQLDDSTPILEPTADLREVELCARSGMAPGDACPARVREWLPAGTPVPRCDWHFSGDEGPVTVWPELYRDWAARAGFDTTAGASVAARASAASAPTPRTSTRRAVPALTIASPIAGATFLIDPTLRADFQALPLRALGATGDVEWSIDGVTISGARWPLVRGTHRIAVRDATGANSSVQVTVK